MLKKRTEEQIQTQNKLRSVMQLLKQKARPATSPITKRSWRGATADSPRRSASQTTVIMSPRQRKQQTRQVFVTMPPESDMPQREDDRGKIQASFKKNLLYREINNFITGKQVRDVADDLIRKRELLAAEQNELQREVQVITL
jgi:hypothetical protein